MGEADLDLPVSLSNLQPTLSRRSHAALRVHPAPAAEDAGDHRLRVLGGCASVAAASAALNLHQAIANRRPADLPTSVVSWLKRHDLVAYP